MRAHRFFSSLSLVAIVFVAGLPACSSSSNDTAGDGGGGGGSGSNLPPIGADQLGQACSGFGTSPGDTAGFEDPDCGGGVCLVDAASGFDLYCSADCDKVACPEGYLCQDTTLGSVKRACFKDPDYVAPAEKTFLDTDLPGFRANASSQSTFNLRTFADPDALSRDLVVAVVTAGWSVPDKALAQDLKASSIKRVAWVFILADGFGSPGDGATTKDLSTWHADSKYLDVLLDQDLKALKELGPYVVVPSFVAFDAVTMKEVGRDKGYSGQDGLATSVAGWKSKAKALH